MLFRRGRAWNKVGAIARFERKRMFSGVATPGKRVSVIGAGQIGTACAQGLLRQGFDVRVHDPSEKNRADLEQRGAVWVPKVENILDGDQNDVLLTALPAPPQVRDVMEGVDLLSGLRKGSFWIDHTTTDPHEAQRLHMIARDKGIHSLEAPLTGGFVLLRAGMMTVLVGGDKAVLEQVEPLMGSYTKTVLHMGDFGKASVVKLITNQLAAVHLIAAGEATMMAKKAGVDLQNFFDGVRASAGNSYVFETEVPLMFNGTFEPGFAIKLHIKDLSIAREIHSEQEGCKNYDDIYPVHALSEDIYRDCMQKYGQSCGSSFPAKMLQDKLDEPLQFPGYENWNYSIEKVTGGSIGVVHHRKEK